MLPKSATSGCVEAGYKATAVEAGSSAGRLAELAEALDAHWCALENGRVNSMDSAAATDSLILASIDATDLEMFPVEDAMSALNLALLADGLKISVADGAAISKPVAVLISDSAGSLVSQPRIQVDVGKDASVAIFLVYESDGEGPQLSNVVLQVRCRSQLTCHD